MNSIWRAIREIIAIMSGRMLLKCAAAVKKNIIARPTRVAAAQSRTPGAPSRPAALATSVTTTSTISGSMERYRFECRNFLRMAEHILPKTIWRGKPRLAEILARAALTAGCVMLTSAVAPAQAVTRIEIVPAPSLAANLLGDPAWR
ncbi:MAG: hypothetical protein NUW01_17080, partial [Gemmatimonadaceae bacterium]|nr:hypothetical protein [Gemmatimonadaceae bacterium]